MSKATSRIATIFILGFLFNYSEGHFHFGSCPSLSTVKDLDLVKITGTWYEIESIGSFIESYGASCNKVEFSNRTNSNIGVAYTRVFWPTTVIAIDGFAQLIEGGKFTLSLQLPGLGMQTFPYWILDTDYNKYLVAWSCTQFPFFNIQKVWILSRNRTLDYSSEKKAHETLSYYGIGTSQLVRIKQYGCES